MQDKRIRWDLFLILGVLTLAGLTALLFRGHAGGQFSVWVEGREILRESLASDGDYPLNLEGHDYLLHVENGAVAVIRADCPDRVCMQTGTISRSGQRIVCLPRKMVVQVLGEAELDGVAR